MVRSPFRFGDGPANLIGSPGAGSPPPADRPQSGAPPPTFDASEEPTMAVPKKKTSKAKGRSRKAAAWTLGRASRSSCPRCSAIKRPHRICGNCGWYAGRQAVDVD